MHKTADTLLLSIHTYAAPELIYKAIRSMVFHGANCIRTSDHRLTYFSVFLLPVAAMIQNTARITKAST